MNKDASQTYDGTYYYYYSYYTYTADQNRWTDEYWTNTQEGTECYSYSRRKTYSNTASDYKCTRVADTFDVTYD